METVRRLRPACLDLFQLVFVGFLIHLWDEAGRVVKLDLDHPLFPGRIPDLSRANPDEDPSLLGLDHFPPRPLGDCYYQEGLIVTHADAFAYLGFCFKLGKEHRASFFAHEYAVRDRPASPLLELPRRKRRKPASAAALCTEETSRYKK